MDFSGDHFITLAISALLLRTPLKLVSGRLQNLHSPLRPQLCSEDLSSVLNQLCGVANLLERLGLFIH